MFKKTLSMICCVIFLQGCSQEQGVKKEMTNMETALLAATEKQETNTVISLLKKGADINITDNKGRTPLMIATYKNDVKTAKALIEAGADVNIQDDIKNNPFLYAGADSSLTNRYGGTALIPASEHGYIDVIKELLTRTNINVNHVNNLGWTALMEAIVLSNGNETQQQVIQLLIEHGADVNIPDNDGVTPLEHARVHNFEEIEKILLEGRK